MIIGGSVISECLTIRSCSFNSLPILPILSCCLSSFAYTASALFSRSSAALQLLFSCSQLSSALRSCSSALLSYSSAALQLLLSGSSVPFSAIGRFGEIGQSQNWGKQPIEDYEIRKLIIRKHQMTSSWLAWLNVRITDDVIVTECKNNRWRHQYWV